MNQKAVADKLLEEFGVSYSLSTISRVMKVKGIPHKKTNKFYKKAKLVSTHPDGRIMPLPTPERVDDTAYTSMSRGPVMSRSAYVSPYASPVVMEAGSSSAGEVPVIYPN